MSKKVKKVKLKTCRGAAKRFKVTGTGRVRYRRANRNHIKTKQTSKRVRQARANGTMVPCDGKLIRALLPYQDVRG